MKHLSLLSVLLGVTACGAPTQRAAVVATPTPTATPAPVVAPAATVAPERTGLMVGDKLEIFDDGQLYSSINVTDCLTWPSADIKARGGAGSWGDYYPANGDVGTVLGLSKHCDAPEIQVAILDIRGHVVAVGTSGLRAASGAAIAGSGGATGVGKFGGLGRSGGDGGRKGGGSNTPGVSAGGAYAVGDSVTIVDDGQLYSSINATDCLTWPSDDVKSRGGEGSWGGFYPVNGNVGTVLATSLHCSGGGVVVAILDIQGYVVAIGETGLAGSGTAAAAASFRVGETVKIVDAGQLFSTINRTDCVSWPSAEIKAAGGADGWGSYDPANGDVGTVLGTSPHCDQAGVMVVIISVGKSYVAIGSTGLSR